MSRRVFGLFSVCLVACASDYKGISAGEWIERLDNESAAIGWPAAIELASGGSESVDVLRQGARHESLRVRMRALWALGAMGAKASEAEEDIAAAAFDGTEQLIAPIRDFALRRIDPFAMSSACLDALEKAEADEVIASLDRGDCDSEPVTTVWPGLALNLHLAPPEVRARTARAIAELDSEQNQLLALLSVALRDDDTTVRLAVLEAIGSYGAAARPLLDLVKEQQRDPSVSTVAWQAAQRIERGEATRRPARPQAAPDGEVRVTASDRDWYVARWRDELERLLEEHESRKNEMVREFWEQKDYTIDRKPYPDKDEARALRDSLAELGGQLSSVRRRREGLVAEHRKQVEEYLLKGGSDPGQLQETVSVREDEIERALAEELDLEHAVRRVGVEVLSLGASLPGRVPDLRREAASLRKP